MSYYTHILDIFHYPPSNALMRTFCSLVSIKTPTVVLHTLVVTVRSRWFFFRFIVVLIRHAFSSYHFFSNPPLFQHSFHFLALTSRSRFARYCSCSGGGIWHFALQSFFLLDHSFRTSLRDEGEYGTAKSSKRNTAQSTKRLALEGTF